MNKLTRVQWEELDDQMSRTPLESDSEGIPGEHMKLIALLNRFGFNPISKQEAMNLAESLLNEGWDDRSYLKSNINISDFSNYHCSSLLQKTCGFYYFLILPSAGSLFRTKLMADVLIAIHIYSSMTIYCGGLFSHAIGDLGIPAFYGLIFDGSYVDSMPPIIAKIEPIAKRLILFELQVVHESFSHITRQLAAHNFIIIKRKTITPGFGVLGTFSANLEFVQMLIKTVEGFEDDSMKCGKGLVTPNFDCPRKNGVPLCKLRIHRTRNDKNFKGVNVHDITSPSLPSKGTAPSARD